MCNPLCLSLSTATRVVIVGVRLRNFLIDRKSPEAVGLWGGDIFGGPREVDW